MGISVNFGVCPMNRRYFCQTGIFGELINESTFQKKVAIRILTRLLHIIKQNVFNFNKGSFNSLSPLLFNSRLGREGLFFNNRMSVQVCGFACCWVEIPTPIHTSKHKHEK